MVQAFNFLQASVAAPDSRKDTKRLLGHSPLITCALKVLQKRTAKVRNTQVTVVIRSPSIEHRNRKKDNIQELKVRTVARMQSRQHFVATKLSQEYCTLIIDFPREVKPQEALCAGSCALHQRFHFRHNFRSFMSFFQCCRRDPLSSMSSPKVNMAVQRFIVQTVDATTLQREVERLQVVIVGTLKP